jgi:hypothetical protein
MTSTIYLTGSSVDLANLKAQLPEPDWRSLAMSRLQRYGLRVLNPLDLTWSEMYQEYGADKRVRRALDLIDQCDALLANLSRASYGTAMEIFYASRRGKMVTVVGQQPYSPWVLSHSQARFEDIDHALDYLIGEPPQLDIVSWALQYEALLAEHYEQFPPDGEPDYQFLGGDLPVLTLAPHATAFFRDGEFQEADAFTGAAGSLVNKVARSHSLVSFYCCAADPCWHLDTPMRRAFADIVKTGQVGMVLLLLGATWHETRGLHVSGYGPDAQVAEDYASRLRMRLGALEPVASESTDLDVSPLIRFAAEELSVPVVVLKMHKRYRMPRLQPELFAQLISEVNHFVAEVGVDLLRSRS